MSKKRKNAIVLLTTMLLYVVCSVYMTVNVEAKVSNSYKKTDNNTGAKKQKIKDEVNNKTNRLKEDIEEMLNKQGIFDIEIEGLLQEDLDIINNSDYTEAVTAYYYIDSDNNEIMCSETEIEEIIDEVYYDGKFSKENNSSIVKEIGERIGILPITAYAATTVTKTKTSATSNDGILKKSIVVSQFKSNGVIYATVNYMCTWLTTPTSRGVDVMALTCRGGKTTTSEAHCAYYLVDKTITVVEEWPYIHTESTTKTTVKEDMTDELWKNMGVNEAAFWFDLKNDKEIKTVMKYDNINSNNNKHRITTTKYTNHRAYMRLWLKKEESYNCIDFVGQYERSLTTYKFDEIDIALSLANSSNIIDVVSAIYNGTETEVTTQIVGRNILYEYIYK